MINYIILFTLLLTFLFTSFQSVEPEEERLYTNPPDVGFGTPQSSIASSAPSSMVRASGPASCGTSYMYDECPRPTSSASVFSPSKKNRKYCIICKWEGRGRLMNHSLFCEKHKVSLCSKLHVVDKKAWFCHEASWTCWEKYHKYYLQHKLFSAKGNLNTSCQLYRMRNEEDIPVDDDSGSPSARKTLVL